MTDIGYQKLLNKIYPGIDLFEFNSSNEYIEPNKYPEMNLSFLNESKNDLDNTQINKMSTITSSLSYSGRSSMTIIRVDPPILKTCSQNINSNSATLTSVGNNINSTANSAPSYDGQFGNKVRAIASGASSQAGQLSGKFSSQAGWLGTKAQQFLDADNSSSTSLLSAYKNLGWMSSLGIFSFSISTIPFFSIISRLFPNGFNLWTTTTGNLITTPTNINSATTISNVNLRSSYGLGNSILSTLPVGTSLEVLDGKMEKDGYTWVQVRTADGRTGWVAEKYIKKGDSTDKTSEKNTSEKSNKQVNPNNTEPLLEKIEYDHNAPTDDCYNFVSNQRKFNQQKLPSVAGGIFNNKNTGNNNEGGFYTGSYRGKSGQLADGTQYGQEPKVGSIMVESPRTNNSINIGHVSYVVEVTRDQSGKVNSYKIVEGNWPKPNDPIHPETFAWSDSVNAYVSSTGNRIPDLFVY